MRKPAVIAAFALAVLLALAPRAASAQATLFYKCTNSRGEVSMQNGTPCAAGMKQEVRRIGEVKTVPVPAKKPEPAAAAAAPVYGESNAPAPRCVPLQVTGIDGSAGLGAGSACEMKYDACTATPAEQLCDAWLRRLDEAEFKLKYASRDDEAGRKAAFESVEAKVKASRCSSVAPEPPAQNP